VFWRPASKIKAANERAEEVLEMIGLQALRDVPAGALPYASQRALEIGMTIACGAEVVILDEPTDGLDPNQKHHVRKLIRNLAKDKIVIISTHSLEEVTAVCTRAIIISQGKIVADGTPAELEARSKYHQAVSVRLSEAYDLASDLSGLVDVCGVEQDSEDDRVFRILASDGNSIFSQVSEVAQAKHWPVTEFHVSRGQVEDACRTVTPQTHGAE